MPIKDTEFLVKYRQNTHKNTDTQEGEFQQYCESCKKNCTTGGWKQQYIAQFYSLAVNFDGRDSNSLQFTVYRLCQFIKFWQFTDYVNSLTFHHSTAANDTFLMIWMLIHVLFSIDIMLWSNSLEVRTSQ